MARSAVERGKLPAAEVERSGQPRPYGRGAREQYLGGVLRWEKRAEYNWRGIAALPPKIGQ